MSEEPRTCRFCLEVETSRKSSAPSEGDEEVIAPCRCEGSAKWVHVHCLQRWQCEVYDVRARVCQVCLAPFSLQPSASRPSILRTTPTNPNYDRAAARSLCPARTAQLLDLMQPGSLIVQTPAQANKCCLSLSSPVVARNAMSVIFQVVLRSRLHHWYRGVFLIVHREPGRAADGTDIIVAVNVMRQTPDAPSAETLPSTLHPVRSRFLNGGPCSSDRPLCVVALSAMQPTAVDASRAFPAPPANVFRIPDILAAPPIATGPLTADAVEDRGDRTEEGAPATGTEPVVVESAEATHDGLCEEPVGVKPAEETERADQPIVAAEEEASLPAAPLAVYVGEVGAMTPWLQGLVGDSAEAPPPQYEGEALWVTGFAVWSTQQLLSEIAHGSWGLCTAELREVLPGGPGLWEKLWRENTPVTAAEPAAEQPPEVDA